MLLRLQLFGIEIPQKADLAKIGALHVNDNEPIVFVSGQGIQLADFTAKTETKTDSVRVLEQLIGAEIALFSEADFIELCSDENLPIIARNCLENGESKNLWYEQILPQETVFYTVILSESNEVSAALHTTESLVQIGANATIGYGYCKFKKL